MRNAAVHPSYQSLSLLLLHLFWGADAEHVFPHYVAGGVILRSWTDKATGKTGLALLKEPSPAWEDWFLGRLPCAHLVDGEGALKVPRQSAAFDPMRCAPSCVAVGELKRKAGSGLVVPDVPLVGSFAAVGRGMLTRTDRQEGYSCSDLLPVLPLDDVTVLTSAFYSSPFTPGDLPMLDLVVSQYAPNGTVTLLVTNRYDTDADIWLHWDDVLFPGGECKNRQFIEALVYNVFRVRARGAALFATYTPNLTTSVAMLQQHGNPSIVCGVLQGEDECRGAPCGERAHCTDPLLKARGNYVCQCGKGYTPNTTTGVPPRCDDKPQGMLLPIAVCAGVGAAALCVVITMACASILHSWRKLARLQTESLARVSRVEDALLEERAVESRATKLQSEASNVADPIRLTTATADVEESVAELKLSFVSLTASVQEVTPDTLNPLVTRVEAATTQSKSNTRRLAHLEESVPVPL